METNQIDAFNLSSKKKKYNYWIIVFIIIFTTGKLLFDKPQQITIENNNDLSFLNDTIAWHSHQLRIIESKQLKDSLRYKQLLNRIGSLDNLIAK
jgi:hypothetical protein